MTISILSGGRRCRDHITTKVVRSNPDCGEVYLIQHYVIKLISYMYLRGCFSTGTSVSFTNKTDLHDITEILLKVALSTIKQLTNPNRCLISGPPG